MTEKLKTKAAEVVSDVLVKQAEMGMKNSFMLFFSEPVIPIQLLEEDMD